MVVHVVGCAADVAGGGCLLLVVDCCLAVVGVVFIVVGAVAVWFLLLPSSWSSAQPFSC